MKTGAYSQEEGGGGCLLPKNVLDNANTLKKGRGKDFKNGKIGDNVTYFPNPEKGVGGKQFIIRDIFWI